MINNLFVVGAFIQILNIVLLVLEAYDVFPNQRRRWWVRPVNRSRQQLGFYKTCLEQLQLIDQEDFFKAVRMNEEKYNLLLSLLTNKLSRNSTRKPIPPQMRLAVTLMYLAHGASFQILAWAFKLGTSTVRSIVYDTCDAIWSELHPIYLAQPNIAEWRQIATQLYDKTGMPHCLGAIDGKLINIMCPRKSGSLYYSYKKTFSIILLAACDANLSFTLVDVGALGSQSDGGVFIRSRFGRAILQNTLPIPAAENLPGSSVRFPYYFVGDNAFPLRTNLMRPFPGRSLSEDKLNFNRTLSRARVNIEIAFGILANRWRVFQGKIHASPKNVDKIVLATIVLHNFLMLHKVGNYYNADVDVNIADINTLTSVSNSVPNRSSQLAFQYRNELKDFLR